MIAPPGRQLNGSRWAEGLPAARGGPGRHLAPWRPVAVLVALIAVLAMAHRASTVTVRLTVDGRTRTVQTHAGTVRALLAEQGLPWAAGDLVVPGPDARIGGGASVRVESGHAVRVRAGERTIRLRTHGRTARALLHEAGVDLGPRDTVTVNGQPWPVEGDLPAPASRPVVTDAGDPSVRGRRSVWGFATTARAAEAGVDAVLPPSDTPATTPGQPSGAPPDWAIDVWRPVPVTVVDGGVPYETVLAGPNVAAALLAAGVPVYAEDALWPPADASLDGVTRIAIARSTPFNVQGDGRTREVRALASTVGAALQVAGLALQGHDYAIPAAETPLSPGLNVQVVRVREDILVQDVEIPYGTDTQADPAMALDETRLVSPGQTGVKRQRIRITYEDGAETGREVIEEQVLSEPVAEVVAYGTQIVWNTVDTPEGTQSYWRKLRVYATSYSLSRSGTSPSSPWYGRTRSGMPMRKGIVAVDPRIINLGTRLYVQGYGVGVAGDTGGGIRRYHVDLGYDDDNYESWHWYVDLYLLAPFPDPTGVPWILP
jgi:uncharacterized protein YabE (DUF348 family)